MVIPEAVNVVSRSKEAAEKGKAYKIYGALSYALVMGLLGVPMWWYTTRVYRVPLPYGQIANFATQVIELPLKLHFKALSQVELELVREKIVPKFPAKLKKVHANLAFKITLETSQVVSSGKGPENNLESLENILCSSAVDEDEELTFLFLPNKIWNGNFPIHATGCASFLVDISHGSNLIESLEKFIFGTLGARSELKTLLASTSKLTPTTSPDDSLKRQHYGKLAISPLYHLNIYILNPDPKVSHMVQTSSTLNSLTSLLNGITNIVINDKVGVWITTAVTELEQAFQELEKTGNMTEALSHATLALVNSEQAFYDPSLLALLYFPDDQKYAIYVPLFLPVGIPVLLSLSAILKFFKVGQVLRNFFRKKEGKVKGE